MDWSMIGMWEWHVMSGLTVVSAALAWWTKRRLFRVVAIAGLTAIVLALAIWDSVHPLWTVAGILIGASLLLLMTKWVLEPQARKG
ncbi:hypothetical protein [Desmospora activa]|uniref:Uncharacterized protein n=1 Tax=Desmospora activa DSM 45169 TaxID=1121389 RepID=A0A2T4Z6H0_9BACL|nr:hypothetical protein [Desmospora activa]PTM57498.1 hypothetical protein C8J48_0046 [Desmospora activa DSM 45169]